MRKEDFLPSRDGFRFPNVFEDSGCSFGLGAPLQPSFGLGAGMAWLALDRYLEGRPVSGVVDPPVPQTRLHSELVSRQANALADGGWAKLIDWQCRAERGFPWRAGLAELSRAEWRRIRRSLDSARPVLLFLVLARGRHANPSSNKAVLAVGYELDRRGRRASLLVYDPDRPGKDNIRLVFRTGFFGALDARLAIQTQVRGFFAVPYDRSWPAMLSSVDPIDGSDSIIDSVLAVRARRRGDGPLDILARERAGGLLHLRRNGQAVWSVGRVEKEMPAAMRAAQDSGAVAVTGRFHVLARGTAGDLLEFRRRPLLGWRVRNVTNSRRIGSAWRIDGELAALCHRDGRVSTVARREGGLLHFERHMLGRWRANRLAAESLRTLTFQGTPALAELERGALHVFCRTEAGDLVHFRRSRKTGWTADNVTIRAGGRSRFAVADDPLVLCDRAGSILNVVARSPDGDLLLFRMQERRGWRGIELSGAARAAGNQVPPALSPLSAAIDRDGVVHVVARDAQNGLIHVWCDRTGAAGGEEVSRTRSSIGEAGRIDGAPMIAAVGRGLHVFARQERDLLLYRWTALGDWTCENVTREQHAAGTHQIEGDPVSFVAGGAVHVTFADSEARAHHVAARVHTRRRTSRLPSPFGIWPARAVSAAADRLRSAAAAFARSTTLVQDRFQDIHSRTTEGSRAALTGLGARFVRASSSRTAAAPARSGSKKTGGPARIHTIRVDAAATARSFTPAEPSPVKRIVAASGASGLQHATQAEPEPSKLQAPTGERPRPNPNPRVQQPALAGLPLLSEAAGDWEAPPVLAATEPAAPPQTPPARRNPDGDRNQREMQRILALAEQEAPKVIQQ